MNSCENTDRAAVSSRASSSEMFGIDAYTECQNEHTACEPKSPYGVAKLYAHRIVGAYRQQHDLHACSGIMFNHESAYRPLSFVSQKIAYAAAVVACGMKQSRELDERGAPIVSKGKVCLGDLSIQRDFGFAGDYAEVMHLILQYPTADDYVIGTGKSHSIRELCREWRSVRLASIGSATLRLIPICSEKRITTIRGRIQPSCNQLSIGIQKCPFLNSFLTWSEPR